MEVQKEIRQQQKGETKMKFTLEYFLESINDENNEIKVYIVKDDLLGRRLVAQYQGCDKAYDESYDEFGEKEVMKFDLDIKRSELRITIR